MKDFVCVVGVLLSGSLASTALAQVSPALHDLPQPAPEKYCVAQQVETRGADSAQVIQEDELKCYNKVKTLSADEAREMLRDRKLK